ncbi:hypothetical protein NW768_004183 [Fusarium equiseti]|uniref:DUF7580 domain-containing protein n=1 Tax=Fusarium equiseti TaxID=61235 RepID=A0ABQ8RJR1_FUSEQ|nr:hypothetical protein NW768_004183 [Fusarium equiseti]
MTLHRVGSPRGPAFVGGSTKTLKIRNAIDHLDYQVRRTFTILRLDLLPYLDAEADDVSRASSDSETESGIYEDPEQDDASSESSLESEPIPSTEDDPESPADSSFPSAALALSKLTRLCLVLEARVNPLLIRREIEDTDDTSKFPRLTRLVTLLQLMSPSTVDLEFIPTSRASPTRFIFNIAEDEATAAAFIALITPGQRPDRDTRKRMLAAVEELLELFLSFNSFVDMLQISGACLDTVVSSPPEKLASNESLSSFVLLHKFRRQTATACRAVLSHFGFCPQNVHKALLKLPEWGDVTNSDTSDSSASLPTDLFFAMCSNGEWQSARMYPLQYVSIMINLPTILTKDRPEHPISCMQRGLCKALKASHRDDMDLEFYVSEDPMAADAKVPIHVPTRIDRTRIYGDSLPNHNLQTLIEQGRFAKEQTLDLVFNTGREGSIVEIHERKALAVKLVVGLMLSMDSDHVFETWDPKRIRFLEPVETRRLFVSIPKKKCKSRHLSLSSLYPSSSLDEDEEDLKPLPQFALLAKALLQIASGDRLSYFKIKYGSSRTPWDTMNKLRRAVEWYSKESAYGRVIDRERLPLLQAALGCLNFHMEYQHRLREFQSEHKIEVAWSVVFDTILTKIDSDLTLNKLTTPRINDLEQEKTTPKYVTGQAGVQRCSLGTISSSHQGPVYTNVTEKAFTKQSSVRQGETSGTDVVLFDSKHDSTHST